MKNPWEWNESDLLENIAAGWKESIELDFKRSDSLQNTDGKKNEISKDVSAFANAAGGVIVYGIVEDGLIAKEIDTGIDPIIITKEWLEQVINSRIQRRIDGIKIHQVELTAQRPGKVVYIVSTPQSTRAPHQAADKRFYKRFNFQSVAMEEYEIRDVSHRADTPDLRVEFNLIKPPNYTQGTPASESFSLDVIITNDALEVANYAIIQIFMDSRVEVINASGLITTRDVFLKLMPDNENRTHPVTLLQFNWGINSNLPIFQARLKITSAPLLLKTPDYVPFTQQRYLLGYQIQSPRMPNKQAYTFLTVASDIVKLSDEYLDHDMLTSKYNTIIWNSREQPH